MRLVEKQRDEFQMKLSEAEDQNNRSNAALTNLQLVLEQFQQGKFLPLAIPLVLEQLEKQICADNKRRGIFFS